MKKNLLALLFGLTIAIGLGEFALRVHPPDWLARRMRHLLVKTWDPVAGSDRGWAYEKTKTGKFRCFVPYEHLRMQADEYDVTIHIDEYGGRVTSSSPIAAGRMVTPVIGDSFAFGVGVKDEETFVSILGEKSRERLLNLSVPGSCLVNQLDLIEDRFVELGSPRVCVFVFFIGNDFGDIMVNDPDGDGRQTLEPTRFQSFCQAVNQIVSTHPLLRRSYLLQFIRQPFLHGLMRDSRQAAGSMSFFRYLNARDTTLAQAEPFLDRAMERLQSLAKKLGFEPRFIVIPESREVSPTLLAHSAAYYGIPLSQVDVLKPHRMLEDKLDRAGIRYVDTLGCLQEDPQGSYFEGDTHLTAKGHRIVASCVQKSGLLKDVLQ